MCASAFSARKAETGRSWSLFNSYQNLIDRFQNNEEHSLKQRSMDPEEWYLKFSTYESIEVHMHKHTNEAEAQYLSC